MCFELIFIVLLKSKILPQHQIQTFFRNEFPSGKLADSPHFQLGLHHSFFIFLLNTDFSPPYLTFTLCCCCCCCCLSKIFAATLNHVVQASTCFRFRVRAMTLQCLQVLNKLSSETRSDYL